MCCAEEHCAGRVIIWWLVRGLRERERDHPDAVNMAALRESGRACKHSRGERDSMKYHRCKQKALETSAFECCNQKQRASALLFLQNFKSPATPPFSPQLPCEKGCKLRRALIQHLISRLFSRYNCI